MKKILTIGISTIALFLGNILMASAESFPDLAENSTESVAANFLAERSVISGRPNGNFDGSASVNRAELAKILLLGLGESAAESAKNNDRFSDVKSGTWYEKFVARAADLGILNGYDDGSFRPEESVNTAEFLKMLVKTFSLEENLPHNFEDVSAEKWFAPYAGVAAQSELFPQRSLTKLEPGRNLTRNEVAVAVWKILKNKTTTSTTAATAPTTEKMAASAPQTDLMSQFSQTSDAVIEKNNSVLKLSQPSEKRARLSVSPGETDVSLIGLQFSAENLPADVLELRFKRLGLSGKISDFENFWIAVDGKKVSNNFVAETDEFVVPVDFSIAHRDTQIVELHAKMSSDAAPGVSSRFVIFFPEWITTNATPQGFFPFGGADLHVK
ncbi:S-layer homology domain-containing protein [bacterium]|mgnify:CR=1 FL=1|jgi:hypothetical protein|nr:S-layer homology domain-containing protein [bacterium]MBT6831527.1 S-layer homology domain-containing protein [bacterium]MBT6996178.1 S-layer homology domain-containing protein [bacterium]MBT7772560.1 S-layer homology domain-containing protein [bacterium]